MSFDAADVDPGELQSQLEDVKTAMGLQERYPGQGRVWLAYGGLVGGFSIVLQVLFASPIPGWVYNATWVVFAALGLASLWVVAQRDRRVFDAGGARMPAFAAVFPNVEWLRYFGHGTFGLLTLAHAFVSYRLLARG